MFEMHVVSDPPATLDLGGMLKDADLQRIVRYDEDLVKPALFFADHVTLISYRRDVASFVKADAFSNTQMPVRYIKAFAYLVIRDDPEEISGLCLDRRQFPGKEVVHRLVASTSEDVSDLIKFGHKYIDAINEHRSAIGKLLRSRHEMLTSSGLELAMSRGQLSYDGWLEDDEMTPFYLNWDEGIDAYLPAAKLAMVDSLVRARGVPLVDLGTQVALESVNIQPGLSEMTSSYQPHLDYGTKLTAVLSASLPHLQELPLDEVLDLRESLKDHLPAFRSEMLTLSEGIPSDSRIDSYALGREAAIVWSRKIEPLLQDIQHEVKLARYPRQVLNSITQDRGGITGVSAAIILAAGSTFAGLAALIPAAAAAAYPFVHALNETLKTRAELKKNRLYFLYRLNNKYPR